MPNDIQDAILKASRALTPVWTAHTKSEEDKQIALLKEKGVKIYEFQDRAKLLQLMQPIFTEWSAKDPLIGEYIQDAKRVDQGS